MIFVYLLSTVLSLQSTQAFTLLVNSVRMSPSSHLLCCTLTGCHKSKCEDVWALEKGQGIHAGVGMGVGSSVLLQRGLPGARCAESLILQPPHITQLVYHLTCPQPRPRTEIRESKCGYDRITACAGCVSLLSAPSRLCNTAIGFFGLLRWR